jgi:hypothetical protein
MGGERKLYLSDGDKADALQAFFAHIRAPDKVPASVRRSVATEVHRWAEQALAHATFLRSHDESNAESLARYRLAVEYVVSLVKGSEV